MNYYGRYDDGYDDGNEYGNNNDSAASRLGSDGTIFNPITTPWFCGGGSGGDSNRRYGR